MELCAAAGACTPLPALVSALASGSATPDSVLTWDDLYKPDAEAARLQALL